MTMLPPDGRVPGVRRIAVLRANGIGDFLFALPALEALKAAYRGAELVLLGLRWHAEFLAGRPGPVDRVVVVPPSRGINETEGRPEDPAELDRFFAAMGREGFDLALQLHGGGRNSNPFVRRLGARVTVGLRTPDAEPLDRWLPYVYFQSEVLRHLEVVRLAGARPVLLVPRLALTERDLAEASSVLAEVGPQFAVLHPGAGDARRHWPAEKFAAVGDALALAGLSVVVGGGPSERPLAEAVVRAMKASACNACGRLSLGGLAGLLSRCRLLVSNDSGPLHLGLAAGAAAVGIYWCGNLVNADPLLRARHRPLLCWRLDCPTCGRSCVGPDPCSHSVSFVADVSVEEVLSAAFELLGSGQARPAIQ